MRYVHSDHPNRVTDKMFMRNSALHKERSPIRVNERRVLAEVRTKIHFVHTENIVVLLLERLGSSVTTKWLT